MNNICYVVSAGDCAGINILKKENDIIIAVDKGLSYLLDADIKPDIILGDFDSLGYVPTGDNVIEHVPEKDDTDTMLAVKLGIEKGYKEFVIYGALGGRMDHSIANLLVVNYLSDNKCKCTVVDEAVTIRNVFDGKIVLEGKDSGVFSVFTLKNEAKGVSISGAKYEVSDCVFTNSIPLGVSNEFVGKDVVIEVEDGQLIVMENKNI